MRLLGNILWLIFGGLGMAICWALIGVVAIITIVGIPWAKSCFVIARLALLPFGSDVAKRDELSGDEDIGTGTLGFIGNIIWFILAGVWLAIAHLTLAVASFITVIGIPFGIQHIKLSLLALAPIGKTVITRH